MENRIQTEFHYHYGLFKILTVLEFEHNMKGNLTLQFSVGYIIMRKFYSLC